MAEARGHVHRVVRACHRPPPSRPTGAARRRGATGPAPKRDRPPSRRPRAPPPRRRTASMTGSGTRCSRASPPVGQPLLHVHVHVRPPTRLGRVMLTRRRRNRQPNGSTAIPGSRRSRSLTGSGGGTSGVRPRDISVGTQDRRGASNVRVDLVQAGGSFRAAGQAGHRLVHRREEPLLARCVEQATSLQRLAQVVARPGDAEGDVRCVRRRRGPARAPAIR